MLKKRGTLNLVAISRTVYSHVRGPKIWGRWDLAPLGQARGSCPRNTQLPDMCNRITFRHCRSDALPVAKPTMSKHYKG